MEDGSPGASDLDLPVVGFPTMLQDSVFLVTGGCGFLGRALVPFLMRETTAQPIVIVTRNPRNKSPFPSPRIRMVYGDLRRGEVWKRLPRNITHVFHLAGVIPGRSEERDPFSIFKGNLSPLLHLMKVSVQWKRLRQVIFSSSISLYRTHGRVLSENSSKQLDHPYGMAKWAGEILLQALVPRGISVVCLRYSSLYGYGQFPGTVLPLMINDAVKKGRIRVFGTGKRAQDFLYCEDAARANLLAYQKGARGIFNIGSCTSTTMRDLAGVINRVFTRGKARISFDRDKKEGLSYKMDIRKAIKYLDYQPAFTLEKGLRQFQRQMEAVG